MINLIPNGYKKENGADDLVNMISYENTAQDIYAIIVAVSSIF